MAGRLWLGQIIQFDACSRSCDSQAPRRVQDYAGSLMEEVAKADCVSTRPAGEGWSRYTPLREYHTLARAHFPMRARQIRPNGPHPLSHTHGAPPPHGATHTHGGPPPHEGPAPDVLAPHEEHPQFPGD